MEYQAWAVIQDDGRGWDNEIGSTVLPRTFVSAESALSYAAADGRIKSKPRLNVVPVKVTVDL